jgi:hypothetical protein
VFAIKAGVADPGAGALAFVEQKTMYGGRHIGEGHVLFIFASENHGGSGLVACGTVTSAAAIPLEPGGGRQTPRVSIAVRVTERAKRRLGRNELKAFTDWNDGKAATELNFKLYRQATDKIVGLSPEAAAFLGKFFEHPRLSSSSP